MPRPQRCRMVAGPPGCRLFKPAGIPATGREDVVLTEDELEAIRLADLEGLYQELAAERMDVSRATFGRIVASARKKVAEALVEGKALRIEGGAIEMAQMRSFTCYQCQHAWQIPYGTGRPQACPQCGSRNFHRAAEERGQGRRLGQGAGMGQGGNRGQGRGQGQGRRGQGPGGRRGPGTQANLEDGGE
jgi:predicted DNA-binding protein (UPF0251 family)